MRRKRDDACNEVRSLRNIREASLDLIEDLQQQIADMEWELAGLETEGRQWRQGEQDMWECIKKMEEQEHGMDELKVSNERL